MGAATRRWDAAGKEARRKYGLDARSQGRAQTAWESLTALEEPLRMALRDSCGFAISYDQMRAALRLLAP
jgi:hypothetical protein